MSPQLKARFDRTSVSLFLILWTLMIFRLGPAFWAEASPFAMLLGLVGGFLLADLIAGSVHWIADRFFNPTTPILGPMLIAPFREHHVDALEMTRHDFFEVSGNNALVTIPVVLLLIASPAPENPLSHFVGALGVSSTLFIFLTNQFHSWAHSPAPPRAVRWLHASGLILTPKRHAQHHQAGHDRAYCVTSGWLNPLLDRIRLFGRLEDIIASIPTPKRNGRMT